MEAANQGGDLATFAQVKYQLAAQKVTPLSDWACSDIFPTAGGPQEARTVSSSPQDKIWSILILISVDCENHHETWQ